MKKLFLAAIAVALAAPGLAADAEMGMKQPASGKVDEGPAYGKLDEREVRHAKKAIGELERADPGLTRLFGEAAGYAVFPTVGKGGLGVGAAHGTGVLYENGLPLGRTTLTQVTVGMQIGGQAYTEVIFFQTEAALKDFKAGRFALAAQVSAVAAAEGASANARYVDGVSVFTLAKGGAMAEASVGGQKFGYTPFRKVMASSSR
jgi:lipid-binding SYLF domain-containing protein